MTVKQKTDSKERIAWIDVAKGIAILMVVLGHAFRDEMRLNNPAYDLIYRSIYIFHMSFFFWVSGYVYGMGREKAVKGCGFFTKKVKKQIVPWIVYGTAVYLAFSAAMLMAPLRAVLERSGYGWIAPLQYLILSIQASNPYAYHLWFIYVLFLISVAVWLIDRHWRLCGSRLAVLNAVMLVSFTPVQLLLPYLGQWQRIPFLITLYAPFYLMGIMMQQQRLGLGAQKLWGSAGVAYILIRAIFFSGFSGNNVETPYMPLTLLVRYLGFLLLPGSFLLLCSLSRKIADSKAGHVLSELGSRSFIVYLFHQPFCCAFVGSLLYGRMHLPAILTVAVCCLLSVTMPFFFYSVLQRLSEILHVRTERIKS